MVNSKAFGIKQENSLQCYSIQGSISKIPNNNTTIQKLIKFTTLNVTTYLPKDTKKRVKCKVRVNICNTYI